MRVLALVPNKLNTSPGQRFRIEQWAPHLRERGIEIEFSPFASETLTSLLYRDGQTLKKAGAMLSSVLRQWHQAKHARNFDLVYVFREAALIGPAVLERLVARRGTPFVFDFDDAVFVPYKSPSNGYWSYLKFPGKTATLCRSAREVMAGNAYLADFAGRHNGNVTIVPTTIDTDTYLARTGGENGNGDGNSRGQGGRDGRPLCIGWSGSHSTAAHLKVISSHLSELGRTHRFRLLTIGIEAPHIPGVEVEARPWRAESEVEDLAEIDIGLMPLPDDEWTRGKCGLKALQYMALEIPTVVSPVGVNSEIVDDGQNGLIAHGAADWVQKLGDLIQDPERRMRLGRAARRTVVERYSARAVYPRVAEIFQRAASSS